MFSHTTDNASRHFSTPVLDDFMQDWLILFSTAHLLWKAHTGRSMRTYSSTRWWSYWEVMEQLLVSFGHFKGFLEDNDGIGAATRTKLLEILNNQTKAAILQIELAAIIDAGAPLVKATYNLEGGGPVVWDCHDQVTTVLNSINTAHYPNVTAVAERIAAGNNTAIQQLTDYAKSCVKGAHDYFTQKGDSRFKRPGCGIQSSQIVLPSESSRNSFISNRRRYSSTISLS